MATTPPRSPAAAAAAPRKLTIRSQIQMGLLPPPNAARELAFDYAADQPCEALYTECLKQEGLPTQLSAGLLLTEEDAPVVLRSGDASLLKTLDVPIHREHIQATDVRFTTAAETPLKLTTHKLEGRTVLLADPKQNGDYFRRVSPEGAKLYERDVPRDDATLSSIALRSDADLHLSFGGFRPIVEMGGVTVANADGDATFLALTPDQTLRDLKVRCALPEVFGIPVEFQQIAVGPRREVAADDTMRLDAAPLETARRLDAAVTAGTYWCIDTRDTVGIARAVQQNYFRPLGTYAGRVITLFVRTLTGKLVKVPSLHLYDTVTDLKAKIQETEGIPPDQQRLIHSGKQMFDEDTLADYDLKGDETLHLVLRLRGGMYHESSGLLDFEQLATLKAEVDVYDPDGALLIKVPVDGGTSIDKAMRLIAEADAIDMEVDALGPYEARALAKELLREKKRKRDDDDDA